MTDRAFVTMREFDPEIGEYRETLRFGPYRLAQAERLARELNAAAKEDGHDAGYRVVSDENPPPPRVSWSEPPVIDDSCPF